MIEALSDPTRRALFERIVEGPATVGELTEGSSITQPAVSQHLRVLRKAQLVHAEKAGNRRIYRARKEGLAALRQYLNRQWSTVLDAFAHDVGLDYEN